MRAREVVDDIRAQHPPGGERGRRTGHDHFLQGELVPAHRSEQRTGATEGEQRGLRRVAAALDGDPAHRPGRLRHQDVQHAGRRALGRHLHRLRQRLPDAVPRPFVVERHRSAEERVGVDVSEHETGVGDGRLRPAAPVADGPRLGARALRTDVEETGVETGDRATPPRRWSGCRRSGPAVDDSRASPRMRPPRGHSRSCTRRVTCRPHRR